MKTAATRPPGSLRRQIPSTLRAVEELCREVRLTLQAAGQEAAVFGVELTARECLNNAAIHGNRRHAAARVTLDLRIGRKWILLRVRDRGPGFNWRRARSAALRRPDTPHGRGLAICTLYARRVSFNRHGNQITLWLPKS